MREEPAHLLFHLFDSEILPRVPVYLIGKLSAVVNHLLHCHVLRELAVFVAVDAVILIWCTTGIRADDIIYERHSAALTKFHIHIVSNVLSVFHYLFKFLTPQLSLGRMSAQPVQSALTHRKFNENS